MHMGIRWRHVDFKDKLSYFLGPAFKSEETECENESFRVRIQSEDFPHSSRFEKPETYETYGPSLR